MFQLVFNNLYCMYYKCRHFDDRRNLWNNFYCRLSMQRFLSRKYLLCGHKCQDDFDFTLWHLTFEASKVCKNACQSRYVPFLNPLSSKKQRHFVLFVSDKWKCLLNWARNHCVLGLVLPLVILCSCFFDLAGTGDWRSSLVKSSAFFNDT